MSFHRFSAEAQAYVDYLAWKDLVAPLKQQFKAATHAQAGLSPAHVSVAARELTKYGALDYDALPPVLSMTTSAGGADLLSPAGSTTREKTRNSRSLQFCAAYGSTAAHDSPSPPLLAAPGGPSTDEITTLLLGHEQLFETLLDISLCLLATTSDKEDHAEECHSSSLPFQTLDDMVALAETTDKTAEKKDPFGLVRPFHGKELLFLQAARVLTREPDRGEVDIIGPFNLLRLSGLFAHKMLRWIGRVCPCCEVAWEGSGLRLDCVQRKHQEDLCRGFYAFAESGEVVPYGYEEFRESLSRKDEDATSSEEGGTVSSRKALEFTFISSGSSPGAEGAAAAVYSTRSPAAQRLQKIHVFFLRALHDIWKVIAVKKEEQEEEEEDWGKKFSKQLQWSELDGMVCQLRQLRAAWRVNLPS